MQRLARSALLLSALLALAWFGLFPLGVSTIHLIDKDFRRGGVANAAYVTLAAVAADYPEWARTRIASKRAQTLALNDVSGTEWPLLGTVLLFWSVEQLQQDWQARKPAFPAPLDTARAALDAGADLLADPAQATWVQQHWGDAYLSEKNLFYRMMLVAGLDSYERLTGNRRHHALLLQQVQSLSAELDAAPTGLLEDYPGETYPVDILLAYAALARAMARLHIPHEAFVARAERAFTGRVLDPATGLPAYMVDVHTGEPWQPARGVGQSAMLAFSRELWPAQSEAWFERYRQQFWQTRHGIEGFREFRVNGPDPWLVFEIDAGPIIHGFGVGASAFGLAAARAHGRADLAVALAAEGLALAWQTPDGRMLGPRLLSNLSDAPYLGESALLFMLSRPMPRLAGSQQRVPTAVWVGLIIGWLISGLFANACLRQLQRLWSTPAKPAR